MRAAAARPVGVVAIALACFLMAAYLFGSGILFLARPNTISLGSAAWLLGGLELRGPLFFLLIALLFLVTGYGLWMQHRWAGFVARGICIGMIALATPTISSAVVEYRTVQLAREGTKIILCAASIWYLSQEHILD